MLKPKFEVCGRDDLDGIHIFRTDDQERAEEVAELMRGDLEDVEGVEADEGGASGYD